MDDSSELESDLDPTLLFYVRNDMALLIDKYPKKTLKQVFEMAVKNNIPAQQYLKEKANEAK